MCNQNKKKEIKKMKILEIEHGEKANVTHKYIDYSQYIQYKVLNYTYIPIHKLYIGIEGWVLGLCVGVGV